MARSTCDPKRVMPKGMLRFEVIRSNIRDSVGQYCAPGDLAILDKKTAKGYLDRNYIKVALPEFDIEDGDDTDKDDATETTETAATDSGAATDSDSPKTTIAARRRAVQGS